MPTHGSTQSINRVRRTSLGLDHGQKIVARAIIAEGERLNVPHPVIKIALATALTEANLQNPNYGDATSLGAFQQQTSWGSAQQRTNVAYAARKFYQQAVPLYQRGERGGQLAQSVQRSAFPGRYAPNIPEAGAILRRFSDSPATQVQGKAGKGAAPAAGTSLSDILGQLPTSRQVQQLTPAAPPLHDLPNKAVSSASPMTSSPTAAPVQAGQRNAGISQLQNVQRGANSSSSPFQSRTEVASVPISRSERLLAAQQILGRTQKQAVKQAGAKPATAPAAPVGPTLGKVTVASGADRSGVSIQPVVVKFVRQIAGLVGQPLTITTGTNHSRMTVDGNVSDHWSGHAADIAMSGRELTRVGRLALIAAGANRQWAKRQTGGLFNIGGHQIIFNTMEGGNHFTHLHVSA